MKSIPFNKAVCLENSIECLENAVKDNGSMSRFSTS